MKRKLLYLVLALLCCSALLLGLAACDNGDTTVTTQGEQTPPDDGGTTSNDGGGGSISGGDNGDTTTDNGTGSGGGISVHRHTYAAEWSTTDTHHWHAATCEHEDEKKDYGLHAWGEGEVFLAPTCSSVGEMRYTCVCGEIKSEEIPKIDHTYSPEWSYDATGHWHDYTCICGEGINDTFEDHTLETEVIKEATPTTTGLEKTTCTTCGYSYTTDTPCYIPGSDIPATILHGYYELETSNNGHITGLCFNGDKVHFVLDYEVYQTLDWEWVHHGNIGFWGEEGYEIAEGYEMRIGSSYFLFAKTDTYFASLDTRPEGEGEYEVFYEKVRLPYKDVDIIYRDYTGLIMSGYYETYIDTYDVTLGFLFLNNKFYMIANRERVGFVHTYEIVQQTMLYGKGSSFIFMVKDDHICFNGMKLYPADLSGGIFGDDYIPEGPDHVHVYANLWLYDETHHWHNAICNHYDEIKDYAEHEWSDEGVVTTPATCLKPGVLTYTCLCGATYTEEIPMLTEQNWDNGTVTVEPTCSAPGEMTYTCECGATKTEEIPQLDHTYATEWSRDEDFHWHAATCEHSNLQKDFSDHSFGSGTVTKPATCDAPGLMTYTCFCGATKTKVIAQLDHTYATEWSRDDTHHWHAATCVHTDEKKDYAEHNWETEWFSEDSSACGNIITYFYSCTCGASKSETESDLVHSYSNRWSYNNTHHWHASTCTHRGEVADYSEHTWDKVETDVISSACGDRIFTTYTCICGMTKTEESSTEVHTFSNEWTRGETHHWYAATCEHSDLKDSYEPHQYGTDKACTVCSYSFDFTHTPGLEYELDSTTNTYTVVGIGTATDTHIIIPSTYLGLPVTGIDGFGFSYCANLTGMTIPDSVTAIGSGLQYCVDLLEEENGVYYIGKWAIDCDYNATSLVLRSGTVGIATSAFAYAENLTSVQLPEGLKYIGYAAFSECTALTTVNIPNSVTSIDAEMFSYCTALTSIDIPDSITSIGRRAFAGCTMLESITLPGGITRIERSVFSGCTSLTSITIPNGVTSIGNYAFSGCTGLTSIDIPNTVTSIEFCAFEDCSALTSINIPEAVTNLSSDAFDGCTALIQTEGGVSYVDKWVIGCDSSITYAALRADTVGIVSEAFYDCTALTGIALPDTLKYIGDSAFENCQALSAITIPTSVTSIGNRVFYSAGLTGIVIPDSVTSIGEYAFSNCEKLTSVIIGNGVTSIGNSAFDSCDSLTAITIGNSVTSIGKYAFYGCDSLTDITIGNGLTSIGNSAFSSCYSLKNVTILDGATIIGEYMFYGCSALKTVVLPASITEIGEYAFGQSTSIYYMGTEEQWNAITLHESNDGLEPYYYSETEPDTYGRYWHYEEGVPTAWRMLEDLFNYTLLEDGTYSIKPKNKYDLPAVLMLPSSYQGKAVTTIAEMAFYNCEVLTSVVIPDSIKNIGNMAFYSCINLTDITIGKNVTTVGTLALYYCPALTSITVDPANTAYQSKSNCLIETATKTLIAGCNNSTIPTDGSVTVIAPAAFAMCTELTSIAIPACVTSIGESAFSGCTGVTSITVEAGNAFYQASGNCLIEKATKTLIVGCANSTIPTDGSVTVIGNQAFYGLEALTSITIPNTVTAIGDSAFAYCTSLERIAIPNSVTSIGETAFVNCTKLTTVTIGKGLTSLGMTPFANCTALTAIIVDAQNSVYAVSNSCLINKQTKSLIYMLSGGKIPTDGSVTSIGDYAFANCTGLTDITIPDTITSIGDYAFFNCQDLTSVILPKSVTSIGAFAFYHLQGHCYYAGTEEEWKAITMGTGNFYFSTPYYYSETDPGVFGYYWHYVEGIPTAWVYQEDPNAKYFNFYLQDDDTYRITGAKDESALPAELVLPATYHGKPVTAISDTAFDGCTNLISVTLPDSITDLGYATFEGCTALTTINIPDGVTYIEDYVFYGCSSLTSIRIPKSVTNIGSEAFKNCTALASIVVDSANTVYQSKGNCLIEIASKTLLLCGKDGTIPTDGSVERIGEYAFCNCTWLTSIVIPSSITSIGDDAFYDCTALTTVYYEGTEYAWDLITIYSGNYNLTYATFYYYSETAPADNGNYWHYVDGIVTVWPKLDPNTKYFNFTLLDDDTYSLTDVKNPSSLPSDLVLPSYYLGKEVTRIDQYALYRCNTLTSIVIPDTVTSIGLAAFAECTSLAEIVIPDSVTDIGYAAFTECTSLASVTLSNNLNSIGESAFEGCTALESIRIPDSVTSIGDWVFGGCDGLTALYYTGTLEEWSAIEIDYVNNSKLDEVTIYYYSETEPTVSGNYWHYIDNVITAWEYKEDPNAQYFTFTLLDDGTYAISGLQDVSTLPTLLTLPSFYQGKKVTRIADSAFEDCATLTSVIIPNTVKSIGWASFAGCTGLTEVVIPNSVTSIAKSAFYACSALKSIEIPDSVTSMGDGVFYECTALESITLGSGITSIGAYAFTRCTSLTEIVIPDSVTTIGEYAFVECAALASIRLGSQMTTIGTWAFADCTGLCELWIPACVTSIGEMAFANCSGLTSITVDGANMYYQSKNNCLIENATKTLLVGCSNSTIPDDGSVTVIGSYAFFASRFTSITIPQGITEIGAYAFNYCQALTSLSIPSTVTFIGEYAFAACTGLSEVVICGNGATISDYAFSECTGLTSVVISDGVASINYAAFSFCPNLTTVTLSKSVTSVGDYVFYECTNLATVYYTGSAEEWSAIAMNYDVNAELINAALYYYSEVAPTDSGNYWHYVEGVPTAW